MTEDIFASEMYYADPKTIKFGKLATFNPVHSELQYEATKESIMKNGQTDPIFMVKDRYGNKVCENGRHRVRICTELGIDVKCIDLSPNLTEIELFQLCNINVMSGRDFTTSQRAIQALRYSKAYNQSGAEAARQFKVDKRHVTYAATIVGFGYESMLDDILDGKSVEIPGLSRTTNSIEVLCKHIKKLEEKNVIEDTSEKVKWNPDAMIKTEAGKAWFYEKAEAMPIIKETHALIADYIELANYKFRRVNVQQ